MTALGGEHLNQLVVGACIAMLGAWLLYRLFVARETYFVWIVPLVLVGMLAGMYAFNPRGTPLAQGVFGGLVAGAIVFGRRSFQLHRAHQDRLASFACELGLSFSRKDDTYAAQAGLLVDDVGGCVNVMQGTWHGIPVALFDYQYLDMSDGEAPAMIVLTCGVSILDRALPRMIIRGHGLKEAFRQRVGAKKGLGDETFDRHFHVETTDLEGARAALPPRAREWLLTNARGGRVLVDGATVMLCTGHQTMKQLPDLLERMRTLRATFG